jgi:hypothetical protein
MQPRSKTSLILGAAGLAALLLALLLWRPWHHDGPGSFEDDPGASARAPDPPAGPTARRALAAAPRSSSAAPAGSPSLPATAERQRALEKIAHHGATPPPSAPAEPGSLPGDGGVRRLNKEAIRSAIRAVVPKIKGCFDTWLKAAPENRAKRALRIEADFTIVAKDGQGHIDEGEAIPREDTVEAPTLGDVTLRSCLLQALTTARFPVPPGDGKVRVRYPFLMRTDGPPAKR